MSIPFRGVNEAYSLAAVAGIIIIGVAAGLVVGIMDGSGRAERLVRWIARRFRTDEDKFAAALHQVAERLEELVRDRPLLRKVVFWAMANWLLDAASLWVFVQAFGGTLSLDALLVAFGLANVLAAIPILPGGLGVVDATYLTTLVGFGIPRRVVVAAIGTYRLAQYLMPIALGALAYASLRVGPWKIEKRDRLVGLRDLARAESEKGESRLDFALRFGGKRPTVDEADDPALQAVMKPDPEDTARRLTLSPDRRSSGTVASMTVHERPFGRYLEDFTPGDVLRHWPGKTITEYDDHLFCMITMNHHPLHTNDWFAAESVQGRNVVVGNLVYSLVLGMSVPDVSGAAIANLEVETLQHKFPTFHGDTIHAETRVLEVKESSSKPDRGIVKVETKGFNQDGKEVCYFIRKVLIWKREFAPDRKRPYDGTDVWAD